MTCFCSLHLLSKCLVELAISYSHLVEEQTHPLFAQRKAMMTCFCFLHLLSKCLVELAISYLHLVEEQTHPLFAQRKAVNDDLFLLFALPFRKFGRTPILFTFGKRTIPATFCPAQGNNDLFLLFTPHLQTLGRTHHLIVPAERSS